MSNNSPRTPRNQPIRRPTSPRLLQNLTGIAAMTPEGPLELAHNFAPLSRNRRKTNEPKTYETPRSNQPRRKKKKAPHPNKTPVKKRRGPNSPNKSPRRALFPQLVL